MATFEFTISIKRDGVELSGLPLTRRLELTEDESFNHAKADDGNSTTFLAFTAAQIAEVRAMLFRGDGETTLRLDGQSDAGIVVQKDGFVLLVGVDIDAGAGASNASANNDTGAAVQLEGFIAGG